MKILKKTIIFILCILMAIVPMMGCDKSSSDPEEKEVGIPETEHYLIQDARSDYKIVLADETAGYEAYAAQELMENILKATSVELPIVSESEVTYSSTSKLIVVGQTEITSSAQVTAERNTYGGRGFVIRQKDSNVFLLGGDTRGTLYAVYEFLHHQFGFEPYAIDEIALEQGVVNKKLLAFDMSNIPDIPYMQSIGEYWDEEYHLDGHRMRYNHYDEVFVNGTGQPWHNTFEYIPHSVYGQEHPEWFTYNAAGEPRQLHYTAHGNPESLQELKDTLFEKMCFFIERDFAEGKYYDQIGFMQEDYDNSWAVSDSPYDHDGVDSVQEYKNKYGRTYAAAMLIHFVNDLQGRLTDYMNEKHNGRKMSITIFAYLETEAPPTKVVNGVQVPIDESLKLHEDANVLIAAARADYIKDYSETSVKPTVEGWGSIASHLSFWFYEYYFSTNSLLHLDSTYSMQTFLQASRDVNATWVFFETPLSTDNYYVFGKLKLYLLSKLGWDVDMDIHALMDDFFDNYYREAGEPMQEYFESLTTWCAYLKETSSITGVTGSVGADRKDFWNEGVVSRWVELINQAFDEIEQYKYSNVELYNKLYDRILYDSLSPRYILLKHFAEGSFTDESFLTELAQFKADAKRLGVVRATSHFYFEELNLSR